MNRELIVNVNPTEISIALCEDKVLVELNKEQCQTGFSVGDIYLGKVRKIMPGLNAAFVNIGHEKDAFIHYLDLGSQFPSLQKLVASQQPGKRGMRVEGMKLEPPVEKTGKIGDYLQVGQNIMVQIAKEAISTKGPRLTSDISLAGRNVVLVPFSSKVFLSQKIRSADEKKRLKRIAAAVLPKNFGVIIRTAAMEAKDEDIEHDIQSQIDRWRKTCAAIKKSTPPAQLMSEMNRANTIIRDSLNGSFSQIAVDDEAMYNDIRNYIRLIEPEKEKIVKLYRGNVPIFDNFDISKQIKSLFAKYVSLRRGAYLIIEHTEAMNVIDVNSGNRTKAEDNQEQTAMDVNLAAAKEIARQLRLRDIGGIIVVDFIDMDKKEYREEIMERLQQALRADKMKPCVQDMTVLNLVEITRKKARQNLSAVLYAPCPVCQGSGRVQSQETVGLEIKRRLRTLLAKPCAPRSILIMVSPWLAEWLNHKVMRQWEKELNCTLAVTAEPRLQLETFSLLDNTGVDK